MDDSRGLGEPGNDIIRDVTAATVMFLVEPLEMLPADKERVAAAYYDVISYAIECAILLTARGFRPQAIIRGQAKYGFPIAMRCSSEFL
jgi:hypothetical protein